MSDMHAPYLLDSVKVVPLHGAITLRPDKKTRHFGKCIDLFPNLFHCTSAASPQLLCYTIHYVIQNIKISAKVNNILITKMLQTIPQ